MKTKYRTPKRIIVSNPSKQHSHRLTYGLIQNNYNAYFYTQVWNKPHWLLNLLKRVSSSFNAQILKRADKNLDVSRVRFSPYVFLLSILFRIYRLIEQRSYYGDVAHDFWMSKRIPVHSAELIIGYEKSCYRTFLSAKGRGAITILDLAQVHPAYIRGLREKFHFFKGITGSSNLFEQIYWKKCKEYEYADYVITISDFSRDTVIANGFDRDRVFSAKLGVDLALFHSKWQKHRCSRDGKLRLIFCGAVSSRKGIHDLLNVVSMFDKEMLELVVVGPKNPSENFDIQLNSDNIYHYPFLEHSKLVNEFHKADVFVLPSYLDSWGQVVLEAMASGLPVIVSENTGAKEAVTPDSGLLIPVNDNKSLETAIRYFIENPSELERMGRNARLQAEEYSWDNYYYSIDNIIEEICRREGLVISEYFIHRPELSELRHTA